MNVLKMRQSIMDDSPIRHVITQRTNDTPLSMFVDTSGSALA